MASSLIGALRVTLGLETAAFQKGADRADRIHTHLTSQIEKRGRRLQGLGKKLSMAVTAPIMAAGAAISHMTREMATEAKEMRNAAQVAGEGFEEFQRQAHAAKSVGIEFDKLGDIFKDVRDRVGDFVQTGGGPMADFFEKIGPKVGITAKAFEGLGGKESLQLYYDSLKKANVSQEDMVFYLEAMAGDATNLIPLLKDGGKAFEELGRKAAIMSEQDEAALNKLTTAQANLGESFQKIILAVVKSGLVEGVAALIEKFADFVSRLSETDPMLVRIGVGLAAVAAAAGPVMFAIGGIMKAWAPFGAVLTYASAKGGFLLAARAGIAGIGAILGPLALPLAAFAAGGLLIYQNWDKIGPALTEIGRGLGLVKTEFEAAVGSMGSQFDTIAQRATVSGRITEEKAAQISAALRNMSAKGAVDPAAAEEITELVYQMEQAGEIAPEEAEKVRSALLKAWNSEDATRQKSGWELLGEDLKQFDSDMQSIFDSLDQGSRDVGTSINRFFRSVWADFESFHARLQSFGAEAKSALRGVANQMYQVGKDIIDGLVRGIKAAPGAVGSALREIASSGVQAVKDKLGIRSPSRVFMEIGENIGQGLAIGIGSTHRAITSAMAALDAAVSGDGLKISLNATEASMALAERMKAIMDRLYPEYARLREMAAELADIDASEAKGWITPAMAEDARYRTRQNARGVLGSDVPMSFMNQGPLADADQLRQASDTLARSLGLLADETKVQTVRVAESFKDMAQKSLDAISGMVDAIKGGGFLDILKGAVGLFLQLGSTGLLGKGLAASINKPIPGYANGTNFHPGGLAMVGERGPELVNLPRGSQVYTNREMQGMGGGMRVEVVPSPFFDVRVDQRVAASAPAIMDGGAKVAFARAGRRNSRRIG